MERRGEGEVVSVGFYSIVIDPSTRGCLLLREKDGLAPSAAVKKKKKVKKREKGSKTGVPSRTAAMYSGTCGSADCSGGGELADGPGAT